MVIRIASAVLSLAGLLALILGLLYWTGTALYLLQMHMLLGLLAVGVLWVIGIGQVFSKARNWVIAACDLVVGVATVAIGVNESSQMCGESHLVILIIY